MDSTLVYSYPKSYAFLWQTAAQLNPKYCQLLVRYLFLALPYLWSHMQEVFLSVDSTLVQFSLKSYSCLSQTAVPLELKYRQLLDRYLLPALPYLRSHMQEVVPSVDSALVQSCLRLLNCCMRPLTCPGGKPLPSLPFLNLLRESHLYLKTLYTEINSIKRFQNSDHY